jgi:hypothetical protein
MAAPATIEVSVNGTEFCRYETSYDTIVVTVVAAGGAIYAAEDVLVELVKARRSRDAAVATDTITFNGVADPQEGSVEFYLPDIVDQDLISLVRHGKYFVRATSLTDDSIIGESADFDIRVITTQKIKDDYLFGLPLTATEVKRPKFQPQSITGVEITETSTAHPLGFHVLQYNYHQTNTANATAAIGSGADGVVTVTAAGTQLGATGNINAIVVNIPIGTSPLSVSYVSNVITVNLSVSSGALVALDNTATLVAAAIDGLTDFTAVASGTGATALTIAATVLFTGGLTNTIRELSWNGGTLTPITGAGTFLVRRGETGPKAGIISNATGDYITVRIASATLLPTLNTTEQILIERSKLDDSSIANYINQAIAWLENQVIHTYVEPTNVVTDRDPTTVQYAAGVQAPTPIFTDSDYDKLVEPLTYFVNKSGGWLNIQTPHPQVLRIDNLYGAIANTRVIDIDLEWIEVTQQGGLLQLVPFNQEIAFDFIGLMWVNAINGTVEIPNFWRYNAIVGLRDATPDLISAIGRKAAIDALTAASLALRPGVGSLSLSRDGVSESISYGTTMQYGLFTGAINVHKEWLKDNLKLIKGAYKGVGLIVV